MGIQDLLIKTDSYALIQNVDDSIIKLNPLIDNYGYRFIVIDIEEFEKDFSEIVNLPRRNEYTRDVIVGEGQHKISYEFQSALIDNPYFGYSFIQLEKPEIILLHRFSYFSNNSQQETFLHSLARIRAFGDFIHNLILQLRLYKTGDICCTLQFQMGIFGNISYRNSKAFIGTNKVFSITDIDIAHIKDSLSFKYRSTKLTDLAVNNFNLTYDIPDIRIRYITLMTCLESLFNQGKDQIAHTISRHLSIIISKDKEEFKTNYSRIKKLYALRSTIVHGSKHVEHLDADYLDLENKVRFAINYCSKLDITREALFDSLNLMGFSE